MIDILTMEMAFQTPFQSFLQKEMYETSGGINWAS